MSLTSLSEPEQLPEPFVFSQSSLQDYADCPRRFYLRHLVQMAWPAVESEPAAEYERRQQEGLLFHRLVQRHLLGVPPENLVCLASGSDLSRWWQNYVSAPLGLNSHSLHSELTLSSPIGKHRLLAKYDLVAVKGTHVLIYDWKTYARRPPEEQLSSRWQTRIYRLLMAEAGSALNGGTPFPPNEIEMIYWFAEFPSQPARFHYDDAQRQGDLAAVASVVAEIASGHDFPMTEDRNLCKFCTYRSYCERGLAAGERLEPDTDSDAGDLLDFNLEQIPEIEF